jgi:plasmid stabilization system protein ParE
VTGYALHPEAFIDIDDIRGYIAEESPDAADRVITEIRDVPPHFHPPRAQARAGRSLDKLLSF